jgi:L-threonylcarbamoyladenylate synthase
VHALLAAWCARRADPAAAVAAPSANSFGRISPTTAEHVRADLGEKPAGRVDVILDGGACPVGIESTIVDLSHDGPARLLRPGVITRAQLEAVLGEPLLDAEASAPRAPGRLAQHYAPRTPLELVDAAALGARVNALRGTRLAVLAPAAAMLDWPAHVVLRLIAPATADEYARRLYALLHRLDAAGVERILVARPPAGPGWDAVRDRLQRAAA